MILEALNFVATWPLTPKEFRPHIRSSVSLWSRARRCRRAWAEHEGHCHRVIADAVQALRQRRTCVVLGSGLLRDVPIGMLAAAFDTVVLVDLVHLATVRVQLRGMRNVRLVHRDLSGLAEAREGRQPEPLAFLRSVPYLDLVISANLLSQIGVGVGRQLGDAGETIIPQLISAHVEGLKALPCPALLITDTGFDILNREGVTEDLSDLMHGVAMPVHEAEWTWTVAPLGEISKIYALRHRVVACRLNFPAARRESP